MNVSNIIFQDFLSLAQHIEHHDYRNKPSVLVQFFDGRNQRSLFSEMASTLFSLLPNAVILGTTTSGEIFNAHTYENSVVLSFCAFSQTKLIPLISQTCDFNGGLTL
ncbi:MAG: hypothetical protein PHR87_08220, partial [Sulfurospirillaceae bacterium]|nr:hypothetical protein [Sulfurospirillaceae bacterium]